MSNTQPMKMIMLAAATSLVGMVGCTEVIILDTAARRVSLAEFAGPPVNESTARQENEAGETDQDSTAVLANAPAGPDVDQHPIDPAQVQPTTGDSSANPDPFAGLDQRVAFAPMQPGDRVIVDSLVGEVNGRPIFADEFFVIIEHRLLQVAAQTTGMQRVQAFDTIIRGTLRDWVRNELILADAEFALTEQEQQGLFAFMRSLKEQVIREKGRGTRYEAEQKLRREAVDGNIEGYLKEQREFILFDQLRRQKIAPRVLVSWRDREREYQRRFDEFNPPASVTLAKIALLTDSQSELIEQVSRRLADGEAFAAVAEDLGFPNGGVWETFSMGPGGITDLPDLHDAVKSRLEGLGEGQTTESFVQGTYTLWMHVQKVERPEARSLYDRSVQRQLAQELFKRRSTEEWERYERSLFEEGIFDELEDMALRLLEIALQRYVR